MKYAVLVADGMADYPIEELSGRTPIEAAHTPNMDFIASNGILGRTKTVPPKMPPASDVANISILGYDPQRFYTGRGPLEAANLGIELEDEDVVFRCNLITVNQDILTDYSSGHISSKEAAILINFINQRLGTNRIKFYPGVSYRHIMLFKMGAQEQLQDLICKPPHDITGQSILKNMPKGQNAEIITELMSSSKEILPNHEINLIRVDLKENPANMIWLWGQGKKPALPSFRDKYGISGSVISAVDLIKGLGKIIGLKVINVEGATGYYDTNYEGKAQAAIDSLKTNDFVFVHVEAPDEAGHNGNLREKITARERFDNFIVGSILRHFKDEPEFRVMVMPDHATPISLKTHVADEILFGIYGKGIKPCGLLRYNEKEAQKSEIFFNEGYKLMDYLIKG